MKNIISLIDRSKEYLKSGAEKIRENFSNSTHETLQDPNDILNNFLDNFDNKKAKKIMNRLVQKMSDEEFANLIISKAKKTLNTSIDILGKISKLENITSSKLEKIFYDDYFSQAGFVDREKWYNLMMSQIESDKLALPKGVIEFLETNNFNPSNLKISKNNIQSSGLEARVSKYSKLAEENKL